MSIIPYLISPNTEQDADVLWEDIVDAPDEFPSLPHEHSMSEIPGLQAVIDSKASSEHSHTSSEVSGLSAVATTGNYSDLSNKPNIPTQASDVGAAAQNHTHTISDVSGLATVATSGSYNDLLNKPSIPSVKRVETYLGATDSSGNYSVTYSTPFSSVPDVQPQIQAGTASQVVRITSSTVNGFTVNVTNRASVNVVGVEVLLAATTPVNGASVSVLVTAR